MKNFALSVIIVLLLGCKFPEPKTYTVVAPGLDGSVTIYNNLAKGKEGSTWCEFKKDSKRYTFVGNFVFWEE